MAGRTAVVWESFVNEFSSGRLTGTPGSGSSSRSRCNRGSPPALRSRCGRRGQSLHPGTQARGRDEMRRERGGRADGARPETGQTWASPDDFAKKTKFCSVELKLTVAPCYSASMEVHGRGRVRHPAARRGVDPQGAEPCSGWSRGASQPAFELSWTPLMMRGVLDRPFHPHLQGEPEPKQQRG